MIDCHGSVSHESSGEPAADPVHSPEGLTHLPQAA